MKKITFVFTLLAFILFSGCGNSEPKKEKSAVKKESIKKQEEKFDFRKSKWGMTQQDISKVEIDKDIFEIPDMNVVAFYEEISGINFLVMYKFDNNKLVSGIYSAMGKSVTVENGEKFKNILYEKYGKEQRINDNNKIYWIAGNTEIEFSISVENEKLTMTYSDTEYLKAKKMKKRVR